MTSTDERTFEAELVEEDAARDIAKAVGVRHAIARRYVLRVRRRHPDATPAEVIRLLERQYVTAISTAGAVVAAGTIAAEVGIAMIPVAGAATAGVKSAGRQAAKKAGKEAAKAAVKNATTAAATNVAARRVAALIPAGDQQLQFEITAIFGLAIADIHGMDLDREQAHALVYGLSNGRVTQQQIAAMAADVARASTGEAAGVGRAIAAGRADWSHWANTLADMLPAGAARSFVSTIQTGQLDTVRSKLTGTQRAAVEYGAGALAGGVTRFLFGRDVVTAARTAFAEAPETFPAHLAVPVKARTDDDETEPNRALAALEEAAKAMGTWISDAAGTAGAGVATAAGAVTRPFRRVDLDGDGIPDAPQALTAVRGVGGTIAGAAGAVGGAAASLFKTQKPGRHAAGTAGRRSEVAPAEADE